MNHLDCPELNNHPFLPCCPTCGQTYLEYWEEVQGGIAKAVKLEQVAALIKFYYEVMDNPTGGNLHIVLDDGNLEDGHITFCRDQASAAKDYVGEALASMLLDLSEEEREQVCAEGVR